METDNAPDYPNKQPESDSSDRTLSTGGSGGPAAGQIGSYRLLQRIGEGGMGEVWLAEQKKPIHRTVALKLIKAGMDTKTVVARFESERQALALMDHPNIAQVYDAGSTPEGRPYFVMEYVAGVPITDYCDKHRLSMEERLELFQQVCDGVQHAHQKAIIHRDLKPSNVLVVEQSNKPTPKIIDFGLAKAMAQRLTERTIFTEMGVLVGTPEYMSPEQADLREQNIDTRTDVYSLGVILYELLVGALPFDAKTLRAAGLEGILRVIREVEPPKPSTKARSLGGASTATAEKRREEPRSFARHLQGELDWITLKALEKDRTRRYGTANELAADIARYLRNEPVVAGPATAGYRIKKYAARHRLALTAASLLVVLLAGFTVAQAFEIHRVRIERDRANHERDRANRITDFMTGMFKVSDPSEAKGNSVTAREVLDKASKQIDTGLAKDPDLQAQLMNTMGIVYGNLGIYPEAASLFSRAIAIEQRSVGPQGRSALRSKRLLADTLYEQGRYPEGEKQYREVIAGLTQIAGPEDPETLQSKNGLGNVLVSEGRFPDAEKIIRQTIEADRRRLGPDNRDTLYAMANLATVVMEEGHYGDAEKLLRETVDSYQRVMGPEDLDTLMMKNNLGLVIYSEGVENRYAEAEKLLRETLQTYQRVLGPDHPDTLRAQANLADVLMSEGHYQSAEKLERETLEAYQHVLGPDHMDTLIQMNDLANLLVSEHKYGEAEKLDRETVAGFTRVLGPEHPSTLKSMQNLANALNEAGDHAEAEKLFRKTFELRRKVLGPDHPSTALSAYGLACALAHEARPTETLAALSEAVDHGLKPNKLLRLGEDRNFQSLHGDARFKVLVAHAKQVAEEQKTK